MAIASTIVIITIGIGIATMIGVLGNEIRLLLKDQKNEVQRENPKHPISHDLSYYIGQGRL